MRKDINNNATLAIPTILDFSIDLSSSFILRKPKQKPKVWEEAKRYPADEL